MKTLILSAVALLTITMNAAATTTVYPNNEKVVKTFNEIFKNVKDATWSSTGNYYEAYFTDGIVKTRARFDNKGSLIQTIRYYKEGKLPANILYSVKESYPAKEIYGVTEVSNKDGLYYRIVLRDDKTFTNINVNSTGESETVSKYKRGDK